MGALFEKLRTSEILRRASAEIEAPTGDRGELRALAAELRVRARWIEGARNDEGVSNDRRMGIAAIEDSDAQEVA